MSVCESNTTNSVFTINENSRNSINNYPIELQNSQEINDNEKEYIPFDHRDVEHPTTSTETLLHLLKGSLGTGILAMPKAFLHAGYILGSIGTIIIGLLCLYCIHLLINAEHVLCARKKKPSLNYPETAREAFAEGPPFLKKISPYAADIVNIFLLIYQLGTCCVYVVFIAENVQAVLQLYIGEWNIRLYMLVFLLPLILINWIRNLKYLAPFSTIANIVTAISFGIIFYFLIIQPPTFTDRNNLGDAGDFPLFFGTVLFALEAIGVIMPLENEMKNPRAFARPCGVLNIGMGTIILLYIIMGFLGYLAFGEKCEDSITLNLLDSDVLAQVVKITLAFSIYITHSLQCYVAVDIAWNGYLSRKFEKSSRALLWEYVTRTSIVIITFLLAVAIPNLGLFISLFGAFCLSALGLAIPASIDLGTNWYSTTGLKFKFMLVRDSLLILFALIGLIAGTYTSIYEIVITFS